MPTKVFFDTNVLIYAVAQNDPRSARAEELLAAGGAISIQVLNEFASVARRKIHMSWSEVTEALNALRVLCPSPAPITIETHDAAVSIARKYSYEIYDALIAASALETGCTTLYSEDMQHRQVLEGRLTIFNPFK